jgi:hypothetical protein
MSDYEIVVATLNYCSVDQGHNVFVTRHRVLARDDLLFMSVFAYPEMCNMYLKLLK